MAPGERQKSEHKCRYQSRKMQRAVVAQGMLETKTNSYHSESRGSHPTEGRRRGGQLTSCRERLRGLGEGGTTPKAWHRGRMRLLKTGSPSQPAKLAITRQLRGLRAGVCVCVCMGIFKQRGLQAPCHPPSPRRTREPKHPPGPWSGENELLNEAEIYCLLKDLLTGLGGQLSA